MIGCWQRHWADKRRGEKPCQPLCVQLLSQFNSLRYLRPHKHRCRWPYKSNLNLAAAQIPHSSWLHRTRFPHDLISHALAADSQAGNAQLILQTSRSCCGSGKEMRVRYGREEEQTGMPGSGPLTPRLPPHPLKSGRQILGATGLPLCPSAPAIMYGLQEISPCEGLCWYKAALHKARQSPSRTGLEAAWWYHDAILGDSSCCKTASAAEGTGQAPAALHAQLQVAEDWDAATWRTTSVAAWGPRANSCSHLNTWVTTEYSCEHIELTDVSKHNHWRLIKIFNLHNP